MSRVTKASLLEENQTLTEARDDALHRVYMAQRAAAKAQNETAGLQEALDEAVADRASLAAACDVSAEQLGEAIRQIRRGQERDAGHREVVNSYQVRVEGLEAERDDAYRDREAAGRLAQEWAAKAAQVERSLEYERSVLASLREAYGQEANARDIAENRLREIENALAG